MKRKVRFGNAEILEFQPIVGDNPSVTSRVPIALGPVNSRRLVLDVGTYERLRGPRRGGVAMRIDRVSREKMLLECGVPRNEIAAAIRQARRVRHEREHSLNTKYMDKFHENLEGRFRGVLRTMGLSRSDKELAAMTHSAPGIIRIHC